MILRRSSEVAYSSAQQELVFQSVCHVLGCIILVTFVAMVEILHLISSHFYYCLYGINSSQLLPDSDADSLQGNIDKRNKKLYGLTKAPRYAEI